jgi:hypothetical protein
MLIIPADETIDPKMIIPIPEDSNRFKIRRIVPSGCYE